MSRSQAYQGHQNVNGPVEKHSLFLLWIFSPTQQQQTQRQQHHKVWVNLHGVLRNIDSLSKWSDVFASLAANIVRDFHLLCEQYAWCLMVSFCCVQWECHAVLALQRVAHLLSISISFRRQQQRKEEVGRAPFPDLLVAGGPG